MKIATAIALYCILALQEVKPASYDHSSKMSVEIPDRYSWIDDGDMEHEYKHISYDWPVMFRKITSTESQFHFQYPFTNSHILYPISGKINTTLLQHPRLFNPSPPASRTEWREPGARVRPGGGLPGNPGVHPDRPDQPAGPDRHAALPHDVRRHRLRLLRAGSRLRRTTAAEQDAQVSRVGHGMLGVGDAMKR